MESEPKGESLVRRTRTFALRVIALVRAMPSGIVEDAIARQLVKAGTSVGANYRASRWSRSGCEFVARIGVVTEEADESEYWLDILDASTAEPDSERKALLREAGELRSIFAASWRTAKRTTSRTKNSGRR